MKSIYNKAKKGIALNQAFGAVLTVVLIGVLVIIAIFLFVNLGTSLNTQAASVTNQTLVAVTDGGQSVNTTACGFNSLSGFQAYNATGGGLIPTTNYTITSAGLLTEIGNGGFNNTNWNITYNYLQGGEACTANNSMITQFATYPVLVGLIGTIVFLGLVIGVLVASFVFNGRQGV